MQSEDYRRIYMACLQMAEFTNVPQERARWRAMAMTCLKRANELEDEPVTRDSVTCSSHHDQ